MIINIIIQARTSSKRFRGKILKSFNQKRLIFNIIDNLKKLKKINKIIVATTINNSDNQLCNLLKKNKISLVRGSENNVYKRFRQCCVQNKCDYLIRISADSPFINSDLIQKMINFLIKNSNKKIDFITSNYPKKILKGQSIEIISTKIFFKYEKKITTLDEKEHVFSKIYENIKRFNSWGVIYSEEFSSDLDLCIDYPLDILKKRKFISNFTLKKRINKILFKKI